MKKFHYCSYWGTWNRCLTFQNGTFYELNLTPINGFRRGELDEVKLQVIRWHFTCRRKKDVDTDSLPEDVVAIMRQFLGLELTNRLLNHDYLSEVTLEDIKKASERTNGGGSPLQLILDVKAGKNVFHQW